MRIPAPPSQKLNAELLLRDVRARLAERSPHGDPGDPDPTDPAWLLLEQAAWMVERLSDQLDQYPFAALQQVFHLLGAELQPALPALGVVALAAAEEGVLRSIPGEPDQTRLFSAQTERVSALEFVLVEPELPLVIPRLVSMARLDPEDGLITVEPVPLDRELGDVAARPGASRPSALFEGEELRYVVQTLSANDTLAALKQVIEQLQGPRGLTWLDLTASAEGGGAVTLTARIAPGRAVRAAIPEGPSPGGDLVLRWGRLNDTDWTPPICLGELPELPPARRGQFVAHRGRRDELILHDLPVGLDPDRLLRRLPQPTPPEVVSAIWRTIAALDHGQLGALQPKVSVTFGSGAGEPGWVAGAARAGRWEALAEEGGLSTELRFSPSESPRAVRVAVITPGRDAERAPRLSALGIDGQGGVIELAAPRIAWRLPLPDESTSRGWRLVTAVDLALPEGAEGLVLFAPLDTVAVLTNAALVAQAPAVRDGRQQTVQRNVPEAVTLLHKDVLSPAALSRAGDWAIPADAAARLAALPLALMEISGEAPALDWAGVTLDGSAGQVTLNAPDAAGVIRPLRPGQRVTQRWYRRTDGRVGNVPAGAISFVEQEPATRPRIAAARNPLPTFHGEDREAPEQAVERLFAAQSALPVLPADFERLVRQVLGRRAPDWEVRCWTYLERTLFPWDLWPLPEAAAADPEGTALAESLRGLGPEQVVIALGPRDPSLAGDSFEVTRREVSRALDALTRRLPRLRGSLIMRLWPLDAERAKDAPSLTLPCFGAEDAPLTVRDERGRRAALPPGVQLLNAAVLRIVPPEAT
ncbi:MAG: hypothetical protein IPN01_27020 [Deltaproteobacteria bacterium]|nr:hypothetical protein [Deltaproteobacteria bacterium]